MGNNNSTMGPLEACFSSICAGRSDCYLMTNTSAIYDSGWNRPYNLDCERHPIAIIRPHNASEVAQAVQCAGQLDLKVQAMSGGHSYGNFGQGGLDEGGVMIDLVNLQSYSIDDSTWQATFGSGFKLGDLDDKLHETKRAMPHGTCPGVGIGGHATVGGLGPSSRMWGSALDQVLEVEVVTADGTIQRASQTQNADLFWALRGAGGSFGIITEFIVKTHPEPGNVVEYTYSLNFGSQSEMAPVFKQWQALVYDPDLDRRFSTLFIAEPLGALITGTFYGTEDEFRASGILERIPTGGDLALLATDWVGSLAHIAETTGLYLSNIASPFASKSLALRRGDRLDDDAVDRLFGYMDDADAGTLLWFLIFNSEGGAMGDVPYDDTAYPHREAVMMYQSYAIGIPAITDATRDFVAGIHDRIVAGAPNAKLTYAGYIDISLNHSQGAQTYWGDKLPKLREIKSKWDSKATFWNPQSVLPLEQS